MENDNYPPSAFYFKVIFTETGSKSDTSFQEVSGISSSIQTESYAELGENGFVYELPKSITYENLKLKRGIAKMTSPLVKWCQDIFSGDFSSPIIPMLVDVYLMDENKDPIRGWSFNNAFPVKWSVDNFNSTKNEVAIETIELKYSSIVRII